MKWIGNGQSIHIVNLLWSISISTILAWLSSLLMNSGRKNRWNRSIEVSRSIFFTYVRWWLPSQTIHYGHKTKPILLICCKACQCVHQPTYNLHGYHLKRTSNCKSKNLSNDRRRINKMKWNGGHPTNNVCTHWPTHFRDYGLKQSTLGRNQASRTMVLLLDQSSNR